MALTKILNDENKSFQPVLTDKLVYDTKPTVNSFNGITSDAVARAIAGASGEVPAVTESDNGKILTAIYDAGGAAVEWADAPSGIPDMTSQDGKILGAVDNGGTMEAQWISKPVSNVTTSDKQFVVGVNGAGLPITVDCANATAVGTSSTFTENGSYTTMSNKPCVNFPLAHLDPCSLGSGTATLTIPEDITYDTSNMIINIVGCFYWNESTHSSGPNCNISESILSTGKIKAGTYTISGANPAASYGYDNGITILVNGSGNSPAWDNFVSAFTEAIQSWTLSYTASEVTGYSITPAVLPTVTGNAGKILTVNSGANGVEWANAPTELPTVTGNAGKILTVNSGATGVEWANAPTELPASLGTAGQVLTVNSGATGIEWATPSGGGNSDYYVFNTYSSNRDANYVYFDATSIKSMVKPGVYLIGVYAGWNNSSDTYYQSSNAFKLKCGIGAAKGGGINQSVSVNTAAVSATEVQLAHTFMLYNNTDFTSWYGANFWVEITRADGGTGVMPSGATLYVVRLSGALT